MVMRKLRTQMRWIMLAIVVAFLLSTFLMYEGRGTRRGPRQSSNGAMIFSRYRMSFYLVFVHICHSL